MYYSAELDKKRSEIRGIMKFAHKNNFNEAMVINSIMEIYGVSEKIALELYEYVKTHLH